MVNRFDAIEVDKVGSMSDVHVVRVGHNLPEGLVPYGTVFADGEQVEDHTDKEVVGSFSELVEGIVPATSWRGV
jgi:hypothetical protein